MKTIKIKSTGVVVSSAVIAGLSLISWLKSSPNLKNLSATLFFSSACVGVISKCKSEMDERDVNDKLGQIHSTYEHEKANLETRLKATASNNRQLQIEISTAKEQRDSIVDELVLLKADYEALKVNLRVANEQIKRQSQEISDYGTTVDTRFQEFLSEFVGKVANSLYDRIEQTYNSLDGNCLQLLNREEYSNIHDELTKFRATLETYHDHHITLVRELEALDYSGITTLIAASKTAREVMETYNQVADELFSIKAKYRNLKIIDERRALQEYLETEQYKTTKANAIQTLREQTNLDKSVIDRLQAGLSANNNGLAELISGIGTDLEKANERVAQLSAPIIWKFALNHATRAGNLIIEYCKSLRIHLDRSHYTGDVYEVDLYFFTDRINAAATIDVKALNDEGDRLAQLTHCLEPIKFTYEYETRLLVAHAVLLKKPKRDTTKQDIDKLWISSNKFEKTVAKWERVRITAGSTGGKSPTAKNLALAIMKTRNGQGEIRLYDPQHGSKKDYWDMPKSGISHADNVRGMEELCKELVRRSEKPGQHHFILYIFDELDSTIAQERPNNDYYYFKDKVTYSLKQASHQNIGAIYIGQACDASTIPGMSWSDWNNAVQIHIGANAGIWLDKAKTITNEEKSKLLEKYRKIQEYCDHQNEELGLDIMTDAGAYRFALAVPLTGLPQFIQLPAFDSYEYSEVMQQQDMPVKQFTELKPEVQSKTELSCPHCGSLNIYKKGTNRKKEQLYECKDCSKTPKRFIPNIISKNVEE